MASVAEPSIARQVHSFRNDLVIQLVLRSGDFWDRVNAIRSDPDWQINSVVGVPPIIPEGEYNYPNEIPGWHLPNPSVWRSSGSEWVGKMKDLFFATVPSDLCLGVKPLVGVMFLQRLAYPHYQFGRLHWSPWGPFISGCVLYDPPRDRLLGFADHVAFDLAVQANPIVFLRDAEAAVALERNRTDAVMRLLTEAVRERDGVDIRDLVIAIQGMSYDDPVYRELAHQDAPKSYVDPLAYPSTTIADAETAIRLIREAQPSSPPPPARDPLTAIQCAIWHDDYDWTYERLSHHFGWESQANPHYVGGLPRWQKAERYVKQGRTLRNAV